MAGVTYASVCSLMSTLDRFDNQSRILLPELETVSIYNDLVDLKQFLRKIESPKPQSSKRGDALGRQIKELVEKLEDLIDSHISDQFPSESSEDESLTVVFTEPLLQVVQELNSFTKELMTDEALEYYREDQEQLMQPTSFSAADIVSSRVDFGGTTIEMVGMDQLFGKVRDRLTRETTSTGLADLPFVAMAGIGKTTFVKKILQDPLVAHKYNTRLFLPIGPQYQMRKCLLLALDQLGYDIDEMVCEKDDEKLKKYIHRALHNGGRYLIVLDDVWDSKQFMGLAHGVWDDLKPCFPNDNNCSRIIWTTRCGTPSCYPKEYIFQFPFLQDDHSWDLLRKTVFTAEEESSCSLDHQLEKLGKKIAKNCEGLPLAIIEIGKLLRKDKTVEYWKKVSVDENPLNIRADDDSPISKSLSLSYDFLPLVLKVSFLYMGVFPKGYIATASVLTVLWVSEGFINLQDCVVENTSAYQMFQEYMEQLFSHCLLVNVVNSSMGGINRCGLHFVYRAFCVSKAWNENFFHVINKLANSFPQGFNSQRRLSIHNKAVVSFKQLQSSMKSLSSVRSVLFFGQEDQQPLRVYLGYRLLRVLHALTVRFYEFPNQVVELVHLRYLAIRYNGREIPPSISRLWNLETLIVRPDYYTKFLDGPVYLPVEIWKLHRLRDLKCPGFDLPDPSSIDDGSNPIVLEELLKLSGVSAHSCTNGILARLPNLMKIVVIILCGLTLDAPFETSFDFFGDIADLCNRIESFSYFVEKPDHRSRVVSSIPDFHVNIRKISLMGCGLPWEEMTHIERLPNLMALKLRMYAFRGLLWETVEGGFPKLIYLLLEDLDLEQWKIGDVGHFPSLKDLIVRDCYHLQEIPGKIGDIPTLEYLEVNDCSPRAYQRLKELIENRAKEDLELQFCLETSWDNLE